ncbi:DUF5043 domain-containing protein [Bacteroides sp. 224]|nr:DUF5043 domain-containing protein [Bacteroides sp. 224]NDV67027.1 DUF5043 domain-containing protein [Bacteroides sp. 224]
MKNIIIAICLLCCVASVSAQTNYYTTTKTFYENDYVYQCDVDAAKIVTLYNKSNNLMYIQQVYKSSGEIFIMPDNYIPLCADDNWTRTKRLSIVNNAFSSSEKQRVRGKKLSVTMYISPDTGKVIEVSFLFGNFEPYATIPVSVYRKIEMELKNNVWYTPTTEGRKLNYIALWWAQEPR